MSDYSEQLNGFSFEVNRTATEEYLKKYWLSNTEYRSFWKLIEEKLFPNYNRDNSKIAFPTGFNISITDGAPHGTQDDREG